MRVYMNVCQSVIGDMSVIVEQSCSTIVLPIQQWIPRFMKAVKRPPTCTIVAKMHFSKDSSVREMCRLLPVIYGVQSVKQ